MPSSVTVKMALGQTGRRILERLSTDVLVDLETLRKELKAQGVRMDNVTRSIERLEVRGWIVRTPDDRVGLTRSGLEVRETKSVPHNEVVEQPPEPEPKLTHGEYMRQKALGLAPWHLQYKTLVDAFKMLADGAQHHLSELFPRRREFGTRTVTTMCKEGILAEAPEGFFAIRHKEAFRAIWDDEKIFCTLGGWPIDHAQDMDCLIHGADDVRLEGAAAVRLQDLVGYSNVRRRTGLSQKRLNELRDFAELPPEVQTAYLDSGIPFEWVGEVRLAHESDRIPKIHRMKMMAEEDAEPEPRVETPPETPPGFFEGLAASEDDAEAVTDIAGTTLKLVVGLIDLVSELNKKVDFLANELGYKPPK